MRTAYPAEFRRRAIALVEVVQSVAQAADDLGATDTTLYNGVQQDKIDRELIPGRTTTDSKGLCWVRKRTRRRGRGRDSATGQRTFGRRGRPPKRVHLVIGALVEAGFSVHQCCRVFHVPSAG